MKIIKINDNLKINVEMIYSLEYHNNQNDINLWEEEYQDYLSEFSKEPPLLPINDEELFQPVFGEEVDEKKMKLYGDALSQYIVSTIGECPEYREEYYIILCTGLKINIDKIIYDKVDEYLNKFIDEN